MGKWIMKIFIALAGAILLDNERVEIKKSGITFGIYGFTAMLYHYSNRSVSGIWEGAIVLEP